MEGAKPDVLKRRYNYLTDAISVLAMTAVAVIPQIGVTTMDDLTPRQEEIVR